MQKVYLVLGGNGFIGYSVIKELVKEGFHVRCIDFVMPEEACIIDGVEYYVGDVRNKNFLVSAMENVCVVLDFIATTMPNTHDVSIKGEISNTLMHHDYLLSVMYKCNVTKYVFPSSGGAIYGNMDDGLACESDKLHPSTPYGVGKQLVEDVLEYYYNKCGIVSYIFRIGNVYGSPKYRSKAQGVIDIFIQNALQDLPIVLWGNAENSIRDYIFLEDVAEGIVKTLDVPIVKNEVFNLATGKGTSIKSIVNIIQRELNKQLTIEHKISNASGLNRIVLSMKKMQRDVKWQPRTSIEDGIRKTIEIKKILLLR